MSEPESKSDDGSEETFEERLRAMYGRYRRQHLEDRLTELAETMEETLLQQAIAATFFEESIDVDADVKRAVQETVDELEAGNYDTVEDDLDDLTRAVERAETHVTNRIQQLRIGRQDTVTAMRRLNERVERVDGAQLEALEALLDDWEWKSKVYTESAETFEDCRTQAIQYGERMAVVFEQLTEELFGIYDDTELRPLVERLLDDERLRLGNLTDEERRQLAESDLADHVELKLS